MAALSVRRGRVWAALAGLAALAVIAVLGALRARRPGEALQLAALLRGPGAADAAWAFVELKTQPGGAAEAALEPLKGSAEPSAVTTLWHVAPGGSSQALSQPRGFSLGDVSRFILGARRTDRRDRGVESSGSQWRLWPGEIVPPSRRSATARLASSRDASGLIALLCDGDAAEAWWALETLKSLDDADVDVLLEALGSGRPTGLQALAAGGAAHIAVPSMTLGRVARHVLWLRINPSDTTCWTDVEAAAAATSERTRRAWQARRAGRGNR